MALVARSKPYHSELIAFKQTVSYPAQASRVLVSKQMWFQDRPHIRQPSVRARSRPRRSSQGNLYGPALSEAMWALLLQL